MLLWPPVNMMKAERFADFFFTAKLLCGFCCTAWPLLQHFFQPVLCEGAWLWVSEIANSPARTLTLFLALCVQPWQLWRGQGPNLGACSPPTGMGKCGTLGLLDLWEEKMAVASFPVSCLIPADPFSYACLMLGNHKLCL